MNHKIRQPAKGAGKIRSSLFRVWTDEAGNPFFPDGSTPSLPPDCFVWMDASRQPREGEYALVSLENKVVFDRLIRKNGRLLWEKNADRNGSAQDPLVLGVVVAGLEWLAVPDDY